LLARYVFERKASKEKFPFSDALFILGFRSVFNTRALSDELVQEKNGQEKWLLEREI